MKYETTANAVPSGYPGRWDRPQLSSGLTLPELSLVRTSSFFVFFF